MQKKYSFKQKTSVFLKMIFCFVVFAFCIALIASNMMKIEEKNKEKRELTQKLEELKDEEKILTDDVEKLKNSEYAARYAREKYFYSKTGEKILKINWQGSTLSF